MSVGARARTWGAAHLEAQPPHLEKYAGPRTDLLGVGAASRIRTELLGREHLVHRSPPGVLRVPQNLSYEVALLVEHDEHPLGYCSAADRRTPGRPLDLNSNAGSARASEASRLTSMPVTGRPVPACVSVSKAVWPGRPRQGPHAAAVADHPASRRDCIEHAIEVGAASALATTGYPFGSGWRREPGSRPVGEADLHSGACCWRQKAPRGPMVSRTMFGVVLTRAASRRSRFPVVTGRWRRRQIESVGSRGVALGGPVTRD